MNLLNTLNRDNVKIFIQACNVDETKQNDVNEKYYKIIVYYNDKKMNYKFESDFDTDDDHLYDKFQNDIKKEFNLNKEIKIYDNMAVEMDDMDDIKNALDENDDLNFILQLHVKVEQNEKKKSHSIVPNVSIGRIEEKQHRIYFLSPSNSPVRLHFENISSGIAYCFVYVCARMYCT